MRYGIVVAILVSLGLIGACRDSDDPDPVIDWGRTGASYVRISAESYSRASFLSFHCDQTQGFDAWIYLPDDSGGEEYHVRRWVDGVHLSSLPADRWATSSGVFAVFNETRSKSIMRSLRDASTAVFQVMRSDEGTDESVTYWFAVRGLFDTPVQPELIACSSGRLLEHASNIHWRIQSIRYSHVANVSAEFDDSHPEHLHRHNVLHVHCNGDELSVVLSWTPRLFEGDIEIEATVDNQAPKKLTWEVQHGSRVAVLQGNVRGFIDSLRGAEALALDFAGADYRLLIPVAGLTDTPAQEKIDACGMSGQPAE